MPASQSKSDISDYLIKAPFVSAKRLPLGERLFETPRGTGFMGPSNVWYPIACPVNVGADKLYSQPFVFDPIRMTFFFRAYPATPGAVDFSSGLWL